MDGCGCVFDNNGCVLVYLILDGCLKIWDCIVGLLKYEYILLLYFFLFCSCFKWS